MVVVGNGITQPANVTLGDEMAGVLNALDAAIGVIRGGNTTANDPATRATLQAALEGVDQSMDQVSTKISKLGGAQNIVARSTPIGAISARPTRPRCSSIRSSITRLRRCSSKPDFSRQGHAVGLRQGQPTEPV
jgi:hypothetical protein